MNIGTYLILLYHQRKTQVQNGIHLLGTSSDDDINIPYLSFYQQSQIRLLYVFTSIYSILCILANYTLQKEQPLFQIVTLSVKDRFLF